MKPSVSYRSWRAEDGEVWLLPRGCMGWDDGMMGWIRWFRWWPVLSKHFAMYFWWRAAGSAKLINDLLDPSDTPPYPCVSSLVCLQACFARLKSGVAIIIDLAQVATPWLLVSMLPVCLLGTSMFPIDSWRQYTSITESCQCIFQFECFC